MQTKITSILNREYLRQTLIKLGISKTNHDLIKNKGNEKCNPKCVDYLKPVIVPSKY